MHSLRANNQTVNNSRRRLGVLYSAAPAALMLALCGQAAWAQTGSVSEVVVTASRVTRDGYSAPTPTTVVDAALIQTTSPVSVADFVNRLPSLAGSSTPRTGNGGSSQGTGGTNFLNLRGMGANRTLVLLDGHRVVASGLSGTVDINNLPNALIERVDVVTGGASAAWGSDAVSGVVNFVLNRKFVGFKGDIQAGVSEEGDGASGKVSLTYGTRFASDRGHFMASGEYSATAGVFSAVGRSWFKGYKLISNPAFAAGNGQPARIIRANVNLSNATPGGIITAGPLKGTAFDPNGQPYAYVYGSPTIDPYTVGGTHNDLGELVGLEAAVKHAALFARGSYELTPNLTAYAEGLAAYSSAVAPTAPSYKLGNITIRNDNPYLPAATVAAMAAAGVTSFSYGTTLPQPGTFSPYNERPTYRAVGGFDANLGDWKLNGYYQWGQSQLTNKVLRNTITANLNAALDAVRNSQGQIVCRSTLPGAAPVANAAPGCVPFNSFGGQSASQAAIDYVTGTPTLEQSVTQHVAAVSAQAEPFSTWAGPVSIAAGVEYRRESVKGTNDPISNYNGYYSGNFHATSGSLSVREGFLETVVPLAKDAAFARSLDLNGAVRLTDYSVSGSVTTWKVGLTWTPIDDLRFRGTRSRDIRAPNLSELYLAGQVATQTVTDPLNANRTSPISRPTYGNLDLVPEKADTLGLGIVLSPHWAPRLQASIDYYDIDISGAITTLSAQQTVDRCFAGTTDLCRFITRNAAGAITTVVGNPINVASVHTRGIDIETSYVQNLDALFPKWDATLTLRALGTKIYTLKTNDGVVSNEAAGENSGSAPTWRWLLSAAYQQGPLRASLSGRFISDGVYDVDYRSGVDIDDNRIPSVWYFDFSSTYKFGEDDSKEAFFVIDNLFDEDPPVVASSGGLAFTGVGTNATLYDTIGRSYRIGFRFKY